MTTLLTWREVLADEKKQPYFSNILTILTSERQAGKKIYPPQKDIFNAFRYTELSNVKVVILGQDPYHGPGQAHGLAFSVRPGVAIPPSLINIYKLLERNVAGFSRPNHGYLESWARQGVLLLNTTLTVRAGQARSHFNIGWEIFTDKVISLINDFCKGVVFLLWGSQARKKESMINNQRHYILKSSHPSPISAHLGFFDCNHFSLVNKLLEKNRVKPINWLPTLFKEKNFFNRKAKN